MGGRTQGCPQRLFWTCGPLGLPELREGVAGGPRGGAAVLLVVLRRLRAWFDVQTDARHAAWSLPPARLLAAIEDVSGRARPRHTREAGARLAGKDPLLQPVGGFQHSHLHRPKKRRHRIAGPWARCEAGNSAGGRAPIPWKALVSIRPGRAVSASGVLVVLGGPGIRALCRRGDACRMAPAAPPALDHCGMVVVSQIGRA